MHYSSYLSLIAAATTHFSGVLAGFDPASKGNLAVYWGQGPEYKQTLAEYCANTEIDIIPVAFLVNITTPIINLAATSGQCDTFEERPELYKCPTIAKDITTCQEEHGKTILLAVGGSTYAEGGWATPEEAVAAAQTTWNTFGPIPEEYGTGRRGFRKAREDGLLRPFKAATFNGFDLDFEAEVKNNVAYANELRRLMDEANAADPAPQQPYILTAAPQCPYPDAWNNDMLNGTVHFDAVMVQFYNNPGCDLRNFKDVTPDDTNRFNFDVWDLWANSTSKNPAVKVLIGAPASNESAPAGGFVDNTVLTEVIQATAAYGSFGGMSFWEMEDVENNEGLLETVTEQLAAVSA